MSSVTFASSLIFLRLSESAFPSPNATTIWQDQPEEEGVLTSWGLGWSAFAPWVLHHMFIYEMSSFSLEVFRLAEEISDWFGAMQFSILGGQRDCHPTEKLVWKDKAVIWAEGLVVLIHYSFFWKLLTHSNLWRSWIWQIWAQLLKTDF